MGLRHITVVDKFNVPVGVLSRKDLITLSVESKIGKKTEVEAMARKRTMTRELVEKSRSSSISLNPVSSPGLGGSGTGSGLAGSLGTFSPVIPTDTHYK